MVFQKFIMKLLIDLLILVIVERSSHGHKLPDAKWWNGFHYIISNGLPAPPKEFLDIGALGYGESDELQWDCGGVLIHPKFVLTAAHCLYSRRLDSDVKYVRLGDLNLYDDTDDAEPQEIEIRKLHKHPDYVPSLYYHDLALLELQTPANITEYVNITDTEQIETLEEGNNHTAVVAGWGRISFSGPKSDLLQYAAVTIFDGSVCKAVLGNVVTRKLNRGFNETTQICAVGNKGRDTCVGDSGGPIYKVHGDGKFQLVGITSAGMGCGGTIPGLYTNIAYYIPWIKNVTATAEN